MQASPYEDVIVEHKSEYPAYIKLITRLNDDRVIGFHVFAPNAGEITQGFALGLK